MIDNNEYKPEYLLSRDAFVGASRGTIFENKLEYLVGLAKDESWDFTSDAYKDNNKKYPILNNYLFFTYDRLKEEGKIKVSDNGKIMCFNTGLQTRDYDQDIYAVFIPNIGRPEGSTQDWKLCKFCTSSDMYLSSFDVLPEIAEYWEDTSDLIFDKRLEVRIDYNHIVTDNINRFREIGLNYEPNVLESILTTQSNKAIEKVGRNYKIAIPQYYADKNKTTSRIQLLLPLCCKDNKKADLALVVSKEGKTYIGKTILPLDWAYMNSRRIVTPDAEWIKGI